MLHSLFSRAANSPERGREERHRRRTIDGSTSVQTLECRTLLSASQTYTNPFALSAIIDVSGEEPRFSPGEGAGGHGGTVDIRTGVNVDTGNGRDGDLRENPAGKDFVSLSNETKYYRQVAPRDVQRSEPIRILVRGHVTIYTQYLFDAIILADFTGNVTPSVTIHAGQAIRIDTEGLAGPGRNEVDDFPVHRLQAILSPPADSEAAGQGGGTLTFHTTQRGLLESTTIDATGGDGDGGYNGGNGGDITVFVNGYEEPRDVSDVDVDVSGGDGDRYDEDTEKGDGGNGGTIIARAPRFAEHSGFFANGGNGGSARRGGDGGVIALFHDEVLGPGTAAHAGLGSGPERIDGKPGVIGVNEHVDNPRFPSVRVDQLQEIPEKDDWTILVYAAADNDLESALLGVLNRMEQVNLSDTSINVLIQMDRHVRGHHQNPTSNDDLSYSSEPIPSAESHTDWADWSDTRRGWVTFDGSLKKFSSALFWAGLRVNVEAAGFDSELNMADPATLVDFVAWGREVAPAENYALIIQNHGLRWQGVAADDEAQLVGHDILTNREMQSAFDQMEPVDIVVFEACSMQQAEVANVLRGHADFVIGSQHPVTYVSPGVVHGPRTLGCGILFGEPPVVHVNRPEEYVIPPLAQDDWLPWLATFPGAEPEDLVRRIVSDASVNVGVGLRSLSAIDLRDGVSGGNRFEDLLQSLDRFGKEFLAVSPNASDWQEFDRARRRNGALAPHTADGTPDGDESVVLGTFMENLLAGQWSTPVVQHRVVTNANAVLRSLEPMIVKQYSARNGPASRRPDGGGLAAYLPDAPPDDVIVAYNSTHLAFCEHGTASGWCDLVQAFSGQGRDAEQIEVSTTADGRLTVQGTAQSDEITVTEQGGLVVVAGHQFPIDDVTQIEISGGDGHDRITIAAAIPAHIRGGGGNDTITGGSASDTLSGEAGADSLVGGRGHDILSGGDSRDTLQGGIGNDELSGGAGNDKALGASGNDTLFGEDGNDTLRAGTGTDELTGGFGDDRLYGENGRDLIQAGDGDDVGIGGGGNDIVFGGRGNDRLRAGNGHDILSGDQGEDDLDGGNGRDILFGGTGADVLHASVADDIVVGGRTTLNTVELAQLAREWTSRHAFSHRVRNLRDGSGSRNRKNGDAFLSVGQTVHDDTDVDTVHSTGTGRSWLFAGGVDLINETDDLFESLDVL